MLKTNIPDVLYIYNNIDNIDKLCYEIIRVQQNWMVIILLLLVVVAVVLFMASFVVEILCGVATCF